jgi:hypothetical protein
MDAAVIYDPDIEMSALVDTDTMRALGPVGVGPMSQRELQSFVTTMPEAVLESMSSYELVVAWSQFWTREFKPLHEDTAENGASPVVEPSDTDGDAAALAAREATAATDTPAEQPADTDADADTPTVPVVVDCFACAGSGKVPGTTEGAEAVCNLCNGIGKIQQPVPAS